MDRSLREAVLAALVESRRKRVAIEGLEAAVRPLLIGTCSDFEIQTRLKETLKGLEDEGHLRLPKARNLWNALTGLPLYVTAVRTEEDDKRRAQRQALAELRNATAWEPAHMAAFAHELRSEAELHRALCVNAYLRKRPPNQIQLPHRERALEIFGDEKALDRHVRTGLFSGRITLEKLDCFYCPEPLPFRPFSLDPTKTAGTPLLVVENSATYWSCCRANDTLKHYAAVVYGQGFAACAAERANDGLAEIQDQVGADGIQYFGDLDPTGIAIPTRINRNRSENGLPPLIAERYLYKALLEKNRSSPYNRSQEGDHDPAQAREWLGRDLAAQYLKGAPTVRWPQEGLSTADIVSALRQRPSCRG
jgi:hypothetical protein